MAVVSHDRFVAFVVRVLTGKVLSYLACVEDVGLLLKRKDEVR